MDVRGVVGMVACCLLWGGNAVAVKFATPDLPPPASPSGSDRLRRRRRLRGWVSRWWRPLRPAWLHGRRRRADDDVQLASTERGGAVGVIITWWRPVGRASWRAGEGGSGRVFGLGLIWRAVVVGRRMGGLIGAVGSSSGRDDREDVVPPHALFELAGDPWLPAELHRRGWIVSFHGTLWGVPYQGVGVSGVLLHVWILLLRRYRRVARHSRSDPAVRGRLGDRPRGESLTGRSSGRLVAGSTWLHRIGSRRGSGRSRCEATMPSAL